MISRRLKAWLEFNNGKVDENTQMFIDDVQDLEQKLTTANKRIDQLEAELEQKDKLIAELVDDNVKADDTIEIYYNKSKALEFEVEKKDKIISELKKCVEFYGDLDNWFYDKLTSRVCDSSIESQGKSGERARETIKRVKEMENG